MLMRPFSYETKSGWFGVFGALPSYLSVCFGRVNFAYHQSLSLDFHWREECCHFSLTVGPFEFSIFR